MPREKERKAIDLFLAVVRVMTKEMVEMVEVVEMVVVVA